MEAPKLTRNKELNIWEALIPVLVLVVLLALNIFVLGDEADQYNNQYILIISALVAAATGMLNKVRLSSMLKGIVSNLRSVLIPILILLLVGALAASWLISGVIPAMIYFGLALINPIVFLPTAVIISSVISIATGSSWTTSATIGIALIAIGKAMGLPAGMIAGAVISGAYFGDKMSPLSDTTNLAAAMAKTNLFTHIKYMAFTTVPSILIALVIFTIMSLVFDTQAISGTEELLGAINNHFVISPWLFLIPLVVVVLIIKKVGPIVALGTGALLGCIAAWFVQPEVLLSDLSSEKFRFISSAVLGGVGIETNNASMNDLFSSGGVWGMRGTIFLVISAMIFGGTMEAIGALSRISQWLLGIAKSVFGLFASTVASCLALNITASDQYIAIVVPGKMFEKAYKDKGLAPENLSRTLEDSGTVTSVLIPWNSCGAYQSGVLGVSVGEYFVYAIFNYVSPVMTLVFAAFKIKIRMLATSAKKVS